MSINDLVKEEVHRQIDNAIEGIPVDRITFGSPMRRLRYQYTNLIDFLLGYEFGYVISASMRYYKNQVNGRSLTEEEDMQIRTDIETIIHDRLPEIRQAMSR